MNSVLDNEHGTFLVLRNDNGQYSLWPQDDVPSGWHIVGQGSRAECLAHIERCWADLAPVTAPPCGVQSGDVSRVPRIDERYR